MKINLLLIPLVLAGCMSVKHYDFKNPQKNWFPTATKKDHWINKHGDKRFDPYYWMKNREDSNVVDYLNGENRVADAFLKKIKSL